MLSNGFDLLSISQNKDSFLTAIFTKSISDDASIEVERRKTLKKLAEYLNKHKRGMFSWIDLNNRELSEKEIDAFVHEARRASTIINKLADSELFEYRFDDSMQFSVENLNFIIESYRHEEYLYEKLPWTFYLNLTYLLDRITPLLTEIEKNPWKYSNTISLSEVKLLKRVKYKLENLLPPFLKIESIFPEFAL